MIMYTRRSQHFPWSVFPSWTPGPDPPSNRFRGVQFPFSCTPWSTWLLVDPSWWRPCMTTSHHRTVIFSSVLCPTLCLLIPYRRNSFPSETDSFNYSLQFIGNLTRYGVPDSSPKSLPALNALGILLHGPSFADAWFPPTSSSHSLRPTRHVPVAGSRSVSRVCEPDA